MPHMTATNLDKFEELLDEQQKSFKDINSIKVGISRLGAKLTVIDTKVTRGINTANDLLKTISNNTSGGSLHKSAKNRRLRS